MGTLVLIGRGARAITWVGVRILIVATVLSPAGCASYAERYAPANEQGLVAAGFEVRLAKPRRRRDHLEHLGALDGMHQRAVITPQQFAIELAVLTVLILALAMSLLLLRRRSASVAAEPA